MRLSAILCFTLLTASAAADDAGFEFGGHTKFNLTGLTIPDDSVLRPVLGSSNVDLQGDLRLNLEWRKRGWAVDANYQLIALQGDGLALGSSLPPGSFAFGNRLPNDDRRWFKLTDVIAESNDSAVLHRLDRLWVGYSSDKTVLRFGRQALSWGNGLFYAPMDLVNPFDPATIDTEYKNGDDMLYAQFLQDNGNDVQAAVVVRRDPATGDVETDAATYAAKYHGFAGDYEYDILAATSYGDPVLGFGIGRGIGGAIWSADIVVTETDLDTYVQFVTNLSYSWTYRGKNMSGLFEYHFNGFGQKSGNYDPMSLIANPDLLARISRGQLFTLGRHYLAGTVTIEMTPLWTVGPVLLANVADPSALLQLTTNYSLGDNLTLLGSINIPAGGNASEFGGIDSGQPGLYLSTGPGVFAQIAWYF
jgi:hypothetical protein